MDTSFLALRTRLDNSLFDDGDRSLDRLVQTESEQRQRSTVIIHPATGSERRMVASLFRTEESTGGLIGYCRSVGRDTGHPDILQEDLAWRRITVAAILAVGQLCNSPQLRHLGDESIPINLRRNVMSQYQIAVVVGSLRRDSFNRKLAEAVVKLAPPEFSFQQVRIDDLPLYNQDDDENPSDSVKRLKKEIKAADGLLFVTPEYNRSIPGVLKNAIDHASRPYGQSVWSGKPAGVIGASIGVIGTALAQQHLRNILSCLNIPTLGQPEVYIHIKDGFFDEAGNIETDTGAFLQKWMDRYAAWIKKHVA